MQRGGEIDPPEFALMLACLRWPQAAADGERIALLARQPIRWPYLLEILQYHKALPLFFRNIETLAAGVPAEVLAALRGRYAENAHLCLQQAAELVALHRKFREQQIAVRVFKGIPLAMVAFGEVALRHAGDIDVLIAEKDLFAADAVLQSAGYVRVEPQATLTPRRLRSYLAHQKDFSYEHPVRGIAIDLHWRLFRNRWLATGLQSTPEVEDSIDLGPERVATLSKPSLLLYLCVHGALDGWLRLKWLADVGALLRGMSQADLDATCAQAAAKQALPEFSAALYLCRDLLGAEATPAGCLDREEPQVARILRFSKRLMRSNGCRPVRESIPGRQWFVNEFFMQSGWRYRMDLIVRTLFRPRVWQRFHVPDALFPLYALLSPLDWGAFHLKRRLAKLVAQVQRFTRLAGGRAHRSFPLRRILHTSPADLALTCEAACMLLFFRVALHFVPVQRLTRWMRQGENMSPAIAEGKAAQTLRRVEWSIDALVRHSPVEFVCFPQSLAAYFMLRRRNVASRLFYGVARQNDRLMAHTWVKAGNLTVVGGEVESQFTVLHVFP